MENSLAFVASAYNTVIAHDTTFRIAQYCCHNKVDEDTSLMDYSWDSPEKSMDSCKADKDYCSRDF